ncbi:hypothetical protein KXD93_22320 [Mucilaginibacter sp. BJC16-A38]|uniref:hypothetical protein n=1 Tax=Mucilaginibacter phenanthrenivorans TaxID=1234842 RepID=UPI002157A102|nr:hypothetical protein [Mucilaginibacter phenanthrenivorans]MCR8560406.1 hypothetical protein [Mucilaginibacter phenanthrenivorans]
MAASYVEHRPHASSEHAATSHYVVIVNEKETGGEFSTQEKAKTYACDNGHKPVHVARQRHLQNRKEPAHWRVDPC